MQTTNNANDYKKLIAKRFAKSLNTYNNNAQKQKLFAKELLDITSTFFTSTEIENLLEIGCGTGILTDMTTSKLNIKNLFINDIVQDFDKLKIYNTIANRVKKLNVLFGDIENINLPTNINAVFSSSCIQWLNDFNGFITKLASNVVKGGIVGFSTFGKENFKEIKTLTNKGIDYPNYEKTIELVKKQYQLIHYSQRTEKQYFQSPIEMLRGLKHSGVNAVTSQQWTPTKLSEFSKNYSNNFSSNNQIYITWNPIFMVFKRL